MAMHNVDEVVNNAVDARLDHALSAVGTKATEVIQNGLDRVMSGLEQRVQLAVDKKIKKVVASTEA